MFHFAASIAAAREAKKNEWFAGVGRIRAGEQGGRPEGGRCESDWLDRVKLKC